VIDQGERAGQPLSVARNAAVVLDQDVDAVTVGVLAQLAKAVGRQLLLLLEGPRAGRVHPHRVTVEERCRLDPLVVILDRLRAGRSIGSPDVALRVAHDEQARHALPIAARLEVGQVLIVPSAVEEERVHVLHGLDPQAAGARREVQVIEFALVERAWVCLKDIAEGAVGQRAHRRSEQLSEVGPLGQGDAVEGFDGGPGG